MLSLVMIISFGFVLHHVETDKPDCLANYYQPYPITSFYNYDPDFPTKEETTTVNVTRRFMRVLNIGFWANVVHFVLYLFYEYWKSNQRFIIQEEHARVSAKI